MCSTQATTTKEQKAVNGLDREALIITVIFTLIGIALNEIYVRSFAIGLSDIDGCPRWTWYLGLSIQGVVYPLLMLEAFWKGQCQGDSSNLFKWLSSSWAERPSSFYEKCWFCAFMAYLIRDMFVMDDTLFVIHHVVCMIGVLFALWIPRGSIPLLLGMFCLEMGSVCMTSSKILPGILSDTHQLEPHSDLRWDRLYWTGMTISNILCLAFCFYNAFLGFEMPNKTLEKVSKGFFTVLTAGLCYLRQLWAHDNMVTSQERYDNLQPHTEKIHDDDKWISNQVAAGLVAVFGALWFFGSLASFYRSYRMQDCQLYPSLSHSVNGEKKSK